MPDETELPPPPPPSPTDLGDRAGRRQAPDDVGNIASSVENPRGGIEADRPISHPSESERGHDVDRGALVADVDRRGDAAHEIDEPPRRFDDRLDLEERLADERTSVLRVPSFSPLAPLLGWVVAWGAIAIASAILERAGVHTGLNLGIADGGPGKGGLWAGIWALVVSGGAFVLGGYTAARMARANGTRHAVLVWVLAMAATGADALVEMARDGSKGVTRLIIGVPYWAETGLTGKSEAVLVLALFAAVSLLGVLIGGGLGQTANKMDRTDGAVVRT